MKTMHKAEQKYAKARARVEAAQAALDAAGGDARRAAKAQSKLDKALAGMNLAAGAMAQAQASSTSGGGHGRDISSGKAKDGIDPGFNGTFVFALTGTNLDLLNINSFINGAGPTAPSSVFRASA